MIKKNKTKIGTSRAKDRLKSEYFENGITSCEGMLFNPKCMGNFILTFHHMTRRSTGRAQDTFRETRLLCAECHQKADTDKEFNAKLRKIR